MSDAPVVTLSTRSKARYALVYVGPRKRGKPKPPTIVGYAMFVDEARQLARAKGTLVIVRPIANGEVVVPKSILTEAIRRSAGAA